MYNIMFSNDLSNSDLMEELPSRQAESSFSENGAGPVITTQQLVHMNHLNALL